MKESTKTDLVIFFREIYKNNFAAVELALMLFEVSQIWDDFADGDEVSQEEIERAFLCAMVSIPLNQVYRAMPEMPYHVYNVFLRWRDATAIENGAHTDSDLNKCYMLRAGIYDIFLLIAAHLYGDDYAKKIGPNVRRFYGEKLKDYKQEFKNA